MKKNDFSDVLQKAQAACTAGDRELALQQLSSFIEVQKPIHVSRSMPKVVTEPFLPVMLLHNEVAIALRDVTASRQSLYHYRRLFSFSAPFTVDRAFRDYIERVKSTLDGIDPDLDVSSIPQLKVANEKTVAPSPQDMDPRSQQAQIATVTFAFVALRMIVDILRCTTMVGLYHYALQEFFFLCGQYNRKQEFANVAERVLSGFTESSFKSDQVIGHDHLKRKNLLDQGEVDSDIGSSYKSLEREYKKPNTIVASIHCKLCCIPLCHTFKLPSLAMRLLESSAADITVLSSSIPRSCAPLRKLTVEYPEVKETPETIDRISKQSILEIYNSIDKREMATPNISASDTVTPSVSSVTRKKGTEFPYALAGMQSSTVMATSDAVGTNSGASPATLEDLDKAVSAHLRAALSVFSSETYLFAACLCRYKTVKLISTLSDETRCSLLSETLATLLYMRQDKSYTTALIEYSNIFAGTRTTNPLFFINHPNITRLTPATMVSTAAFCFDKQVRAICLEAIPIYASKNLAYSNVFSTFSGATTSTSILDFVLQDILGSYLGAIEPDLLNFLSTLYFNSDLLVKTSAASFIKQFAEDLLKVHGKWILGDSCLHLHKAGVSRAITLLCIERSRDELIAYVRSNPKYTSESLSGLTTKVPLSKIMTDLEYMFSGKLENSDLYSENFLQNAILAILGSKALIGKYDFTSKEVVLSTQKTVSFFYLGAVDTCFITKKLGTKPAAEDQSAAAIKKKIAADQSAQLEGTKLDDLTYAQLIVAGCISDIRKSDLMAQRLGKVRQAQLSAQLRMVRITAAHELEQQKLREYKEMIIQRQKRDEALDLETQAKQRQAKRAAEVRQLQIKMAKQFIDDVAIKMHDTELIDYLTSFDLESINDPNDYIKIMHYKFETNRAKQKIDRDIRTSNLADLTLSVARKHATERLKELDQLENQYLQPILKTMHELSQQHEKEQHEASLKQLEMYDNIPGLDSFFNAYIDDCRQIYSVEYGKWKEERDALLEKITKEIQEKVEDKSKKKLSMISRLKDKAQLVQKEQSATATAAPATTQEPAKSAPRSYADRFTNRK